MSVSRIPLQETLAFLEANEECVRLRESARFPEIRIEEGDRPAYSVWETNSIVLSPSLLFRDKIGKIYSDALQSIIFEMANLAKGSEFTDLIADRIKRLTPDQFVEQYERIEHQSALAARSILRKCIEVRDWGKARLAFVSEKFGPHYLFQQAGGHSQRIWNRYGARFEKDARYSGTLAPVSDKEKPLVLSLLSLRILAADPEASVSKKAQEDYQFFKEYLTRNKVQGLDLSPRIKEIETSFQTD